MLPLAVFFAWVFVGAIICFLILGPQRYRKRRQRWPCISLSSRSSISGPDVDIERAMPSPLSAKKSAFKASRLTPSCFLIVEHSDIYSEHPFIYAKIVPEAGTIVLLDTGCGGATHDTEIELKSLRTFIETVGVADNGGKPLNEGGKMRYVVVLSHCHYDHILGVEQFATDSPILASSHAPEFLSPKDLPKHTLCESLGIDVPEYTPTLVDHRQELRVHYASSPLGVVVLHTPGHTPDQLALWDEKERMLYVGDTVYEWEHIIFPSEGSIVTWLQTMDSLIDLVDGVDAKINCGHVTAGRPALDVLQGAKMFMMRVVMGKEVVKSRMMRRGEEFVEYVQPDGPFSLICPERLVTQARRESL